MKNIISSLSRLIIAVAFSTVLILAFNTHSASAQQNTASKTKEATLSVFPKIPIKGCRGGRAKLYDECGSQVKIFQIALERARAEGKTLLVSYGAEWCIWCHVFEAYIKGEHDRFTHTYSDPSDQKRYTSTLYERANSSPVRMANKVAQFTSENFVIVHIENRYSDDGFDVLIKTLADNEFNGGLPFIYSVTRDGEFFKSFNSSAAETRRDTADWFRGYNRRALLRELKRMEFNTTP